ncbi:phosphatidate cytidylyltransferase [Prochlorococcus sp. MIT 1307]|uniref:phosphatidate cytidylyltransferase n=1 Tax=Prochlorococcus sp. MIT 1307 TaxID=3096219 RepID=UPI002A75A43C|nr:phosphatidate cytidylyltransferase [Prochlorococcus sp. MIT 1307]
MGSVFFRNRFLSGLWAGVFGILVVGLGGWWFTLALGVIVHLALLEFFRMAQFTGIRPATKTTLVACHLLLISTQCGVNGVLSGELTSAVLPLSGAAICGWLLLQPVTGSIADIAASIFGLFYLGFLPSHWLKLRSLSGIEFKQGLHLLPLDWPAFASFGMVITFMACLMIVAADIGSYFFGLSFGRHSLSPISPGKTVEGAIGGFLCAMAIGAISGELFKLKLGFLIGGFLGAFVALFALVGDLTESMMKRNAGLKDSGDVLPGHGGILDRIDSYLFTPAVVYYVVILLMPFLNR